ncbi:DUF4012 domain-containing protein [Sulfobacillus thermosulfidooxidans]|uniref:DUF4012 domain-containing protein n=1 Tax=Sulfobacillus thermosulfidooxidans TaxID=28034 RepID=UPI0004000CD0|nr:DUF4012 domain-containing protein [Sulfobacillus thermosulfidooxidans]
MKPQPLQSHQSRHNKRRRLKRGLRLGILVMFLAALSIGIGVPLYQASQGYQQLRMAQQIIRTDLRQHQLRQFPQALRDLSESSVHLKRALIFTAYAQFLPSVQIPYQNLVDLQIATQNISQALSEMSPAIELSSRALDFPSRPSHLEDNSTHSHFSSLESMVQAIKMLSPALIRSQPHWQQAATALKHVNWSAFEGILSPHTLSQLRSTSHVFDQVVAAIPVLTHSSQVLQQILGIPLSQTYLVLFQNSGELRPTGGFITAYSVITVKDGQIQIGASHNIYSLQNQVTYRPLAPSILHYVYTQHWHLRDANISPNLPTTVGYIQRFYSSIKGAPPINGMIFVNTWLVDDLLKVMGPLRLPASYHHLTITWQNANMTMETIAEHSHLPQATRKAFIGVMMQELLTQAFKARGSALVHILNTLYHGLQRKYLLLWFANTKSEELAVHYHWAGRIRPHVPSDYLEVVDMNLGGHKDNFFMREVVDVRITQQHDRYVQSDTITWYNPALDNGWLVVPYQAYVRVYVPLGSKLISITAGNGAIFDYNNLTVNKTVFGRHISLPGRTSLSQPARRGSMTFTYLLPKTLPMTSLWIQKQPGIRVEPYHISFGSFHRSVTLLEDMEIPLSFHDAHHV